MTAGRTGYLSSVITVLIGAVAAQAVPLIAMPFITRLVDPQDLGLYSAWMGLIAVGAVLASGRAEVLIVVAPTQQDKRTCLSLALWISALVSLLLGLVALLGQQSLAKHINGWTPAASVGMAIGIWGLALNQVWRAYAAVAGRFALLSWVRLIPAALTALLQIAGAYWLGGTIGLLWGYVLGMASGVLAGRLLLGSLLHADSQRPSRASLLSFLKEHSRIPLYAMPSDLISNVAQQLPILLISSHYGPTFAGFYALTQRTLDAPVSVFSSSVLDVYKRRATEEFNERRHCRPAFMHTLKLLALVAVVPSVALAVAGPWLFSFVYGSAWRESGLLATALIPMMFFRFFASPLGYTLYIANKANQQLLWQIGLLVMTVVVFYLPVEGFTAIMLYSAGYSLMYMLYLFISYRAATGASESNNGSRE